MSGERVAWCLLWVVLSTGALWAGKFPTDSHPPTLEMARDLLHAVCPADAIAATGQHGVNAGCKSCPEIGVSEVGASSVASGEAAFSLQGVTYGSFTRERVQEVVASFSGCEPHVNNFGGSVLLEETSAGWKVKNYQPGFISDECSKYALRSGRDLLLCHGGYVGQGQVYSVIFSFDYTLPPDQRTKTIFSTTDTVDACFLDRRVMGSIEYVQLRDLNGDGMPDIAVGVEAATVKPLSGHEHDCTEALARPTVKIQELDFLFTDGTFKVAPWSVQTKQALDALFAQ